LTNFGKNDMTKSDSNFTQKITLIIQFLVHTIQHTTLLDHTVPEI